MAEEKRKISAPSICAHGMGSSLDVPAICMRRKRGLSFRGLGLAYSARKAAFLDALRENNGVIKLWFRVEHERMIFRTSLLIATSKTYEKFSPDYRQRRPLVRWRHRLIRLGSTLSALEQALKSEVALIPVEARSRLDGQGGFRAGMKGRRIKATRYSERRARDTWVGNAGVAMEQPLRYSTPEVPHGTGLHKISTSTRNRYVISLQRWLKTPPSTSQFRQRGAQDRRWATSDDKDPFPEFKPTLSHLYSFFLTAISQGMNTEIDSANAMMVERKACLNREFRCRNLTNDCVLNRNNHPTNRLVSLFLVGGVVNLTNIPETRTTKRCNESQIAVWHPAQFKTFFRKLAPLLSPEKPNCRKSRRRLSRDLRASDIAVPSFPSARFYRFIRFASLHDERNLATKKNLTNDGCLPHSTRGHRGRFMGFKCTSPRPTDQTDSKLSIKMFAQPRLRRFLSRDKVHNFRTTYKPCCYLHPSENSTFHICLRFVYQSIFRSLHSR
ncbi:hypothetical protein ALC53_10955 [Atta colombica]|uniref:Uncharacterized protein n=1 Tax=Atta colombica TaxID=520822 RepID=A0A151I002_9HYME|nr:hypothetical protein ALC53_10955 [Atta colombica]